MRCGCESGPCQCLFTASDCVGVSGVGTEGDPFTPFLVLSDDARQILECRDDGAYVPEWIDEQTVASVAALVLPSTGKTFTVTGTTSITSIDATGNSGRDVFLVFTGVLTMTDGSNLRLAGNFATTADDTMHLACLGANWFEIGRSVN